ncbi:protease modulator HflC [Nitrospirillum viridazoti]|uniref:Protein HflC n=1 Tax=Nitrospirillum viridazoti CBAmc TaxID=1441467 RepID=A0A248JMP6_9PROT|nr:protease modulator HflC [Nitrospirillum amazonense]ASG19975.1 HflC protein [Nitrospirillum amazonense CBAmc]TWB36338.1 protease FtsH subunit HflC [Nitrospirillum amazonense]
MEKRWILPLGLLVLAAILLQGSFFTLNQTQQALVLQFGEPKRVIREPGLWVKIPFVQNVVILDRRVLDIDPPVESAILADQKRLEVDAYARYRIADPLMFFQTLGNEQQARLRLSVIVNSAMRRVLGNVNLPAVLSQEREKVMADIKGQVNQEAQRLGIEIVDVRLRRADLPEQTSQAVFARMRSEREREAAEARAQGQELSQQIKSRADRDRTVLLAEAQRQAQITRGEGDNQAIRIMNEAISRNPEFYSFYRSLQAYRDTLKPDDTTLVLSPGADFFKYLGASGGAGDHRRADK